MKKGTVFLLSLVSLLSGILVGFLLAPVKNGVRIIGNISGNADKPQKNLKKNGRIYPFLMTTRTNPYSFL